MVTVRTLAFAGAAVLSTALLTSCEGGPTGVGGEAPESGRPVEVSASAFPFPLGLDVHHVWALPTSVSASSYGATASKDFAFFGLARPGEGGVDAEVTSDERTTYAAMNLTTGEIATFPAVEVGRYSRLGVAVDAGTDTYLVHREEQVWPPEECPQSPQYCWTWSLYAQRLPDGEVTQIAAARQPGPQLTMPRPVAFEGGAVWLTDGATSGGFDLSKWTPTDSSTVLARDLPWGEVSVEAGAAWVGVDGDESTRGQLWSVDLGTGARVRRDLPAGATNAVVVDERVQYVLRDDGEHPMSVVSAPVRTPTKASVLASGLSDVYVLVALSPTQAVISDPSGGYWLTGDSGGVLSGVPQLWGVHRSNGELAFFIRDGASRVLVVAE